VSGCLSKNSLVDLSGKSRSAEVVTYRSRENPMVDSDWSGPPRSNQSNSSDSVRSEFGQSFICLETSAHSNHTEADDVCRQRTLVHSQETNCCLTLRPPSVTAQRQYESCCQLLLQRSVP